MPHPLLGDDASMGRLLDLLPAAVYTCVAPTGEIALYNAEAVRLWGRTPVRGESDQRFCGSLRLWRSDGSPLPHDQTPMALALRTGEPARQEEVVIERPDGTRLPVIVNIDPILDDRGTLVGAINVFHDASTLQERHEMRARLIAIIESSDDAIVSKDLDGVITSWNRAAERLFGYQAAEAIGRPITMLIPEDHQEEEPAILRRIRRGERIDHFETVRQHRDGTRLDLSITVSPIIVRGRIVGASKVARDVTERNRAAALLAREQEAVRRLYDLGLRCVRPGDHRDDNLHAVLDTAIWMTDATRGLVHLRESPAGAFRLAAQRGLERTALASFATLAREDLAAWWPRLAGGERIVVPDVAHARAGNAWIRDRLGAGAAGGWLTLPMLGSDGLVLGLVSTLNDGPHDVSPRAGGLLDLLSRQAADYLERLRDDEDRAQLLKDAEAANRAKDEFLAMLGHELRNPLAAVRNAISAASLDDSIRPRALEIARRQADQLTRIVGDLLDVARITRGRIPLRKDVVSLAHLVERAVDAALALMQERGIRLITSLPETPVHLEADAARLEQALANLFSNAAKFTGPGGTVTVDARRESDGTAMISVRDTGAGIPPDRLVDIFEPFSQTTRSLDRAHGGLGLGLTLVRRIVELHNGSVEAFSEGEGRGATFTLRLPAVPRPASVDAAPAAAGTGSDAPRPARVLVVEDHPDAAEALTLVLERFGHQVRTVHDGIAALDAARAETPDLMLIDIGLPGMNGYDVAHTVRNDRELADVVLVALTGYGQPEDRARATAAGFDHHLVKPVDYDALEAIVRDLASSQPGRP